VLELIADHVLDLVDGLLHPGRVVKRRRRFLPVADDLLVRARVGDLDSESFGGSEGGSDAA
jgi:hypothetical protein